MRFKKLAVGTQQGIQALWSIATDMSSSRQENELLASQKPPKTARRLAQLLFTDLIESLQKMLDHVKLVIDNLRFRALGKKTVSKGFPHVDDPMSDAPGPFLSKPLPELGQMLFSSAFPNEQQFWPPGSLQGTDQVPVSLSLSHSNLINAQNRNPIQGAKGLHLFQGQFIDGLHRPPMQALKDRHRLDRHDLAQLCYQRCQGLADSCPPGNHGKRVEGQAPRRAIYPVASHPKKCQELPQRQMLDLDQTTRISLSDAPLAFLTFKAPTPPVEFQDHCFSTLSVFND